MDKVKVLSIDTAPAQKSIKELRKELNEYKNQMANLDADSDAFKSVALQAGEVKHQIDEINESVKGASSDIGDMIGNATNVAAGLVGAFQAVQGGLQAMGVESEAVNETIAKMQGLMAMTQGLAAIDDGIKSFGKLTKAIGLTNTSLKGTKKALISTGIGALVVVLGSIIANWEEFSEAIGISNTTMEKFGQVAAGVLNVVLSSVKGLGTAISRLISGDFKGAAESAKQAFDVVENYQAGVAKKIEKQEQEAIDNRKARLKEVQSKIKQYREEESEGYKHTLKEQEEYDRLLKEEITLKDAIYKTNWRLIEQNKQRQEAASAEAKRLLFEIDKFSINNKNFIYSEDGYKLMMKYYDEQSKALDKSSDEYRDVQLEKLRYLQEFNNYKKSLADQELAEEKKQAFEKLELFKTTVIERKKIEDKNYINSDDYLNDMLYYFDELADLYKEDEVKYEEFINRKLEFLKNFKNASKETNKEIKEDIKNWQEEILDLLKSDELEDRLKGVSMIAKQTGEIFDTMFSAIQANMDENSKAYKDIEAANIVISTLTGIVTAFSTAMQLGPIAGPIVGAINSAAVLATGIANLNALKKTTKDNATLNGSGISNSTPSATAIGAVTAAPVRQDINGASITKAINNKNSTRVYVLESDITNTQNKVNVQEKENVF